MTRLEIARTTDQRAWIQRPSPGPTSPLARPGPLPEPAAPTFFEFRRGEGFLRGGAGRAERVPVRGLAFDLLERDAVPVRARRRLTCHARKTSRNHPNFTISNTGHR